MPAMNVRRLAAAAAAAACLPAVSAVQLGPTGPVQTSPAELNDIPFDISPPTITPGPAARAILQKRDTATCGYVNGDGENGYVCANPDARCLYNDQASAVGCCLTTSCNIYTACLDYASSSATKTFNADRTRFCSNSALPYCGYYQYDEDETSLGGYTIPTCDSTRGSYIIFLTSTGGSTSTTESSSESSSATSKSSSASSTESGSATGTELPSETSSTATATAEPSSGTPIGAIVGGVVGGIAALALVGLGVFFLMRRNSKNNRHNSPPATAVGTVPPSFPGGPPGGPYQQLPNQAHTSPQPHMSVMGDPAALDPRYNNGGLHSPHSPHMSVSPQGTPSPAPFGPPQQYAQGLGVGPMGTPPPQHQGLGTPPPQGYGAPPSPGHSVGGYAPYGAPSPMHQHQQQYGQGPYGAPQQQVPQQHHAPVELPTQRGDGQVYEMS